MLVNCFIERYFNLLPVLIMVDLKNLIEGVFISNGREGKFSY